MMELPIRINLKAKNLKCFGAKEQGFSFIERFNIIIGRNNSGKSTLIDLIEYIANPSQDTVRLLGHKNRNPEVFIDLQIDEATIKKVFSSSSAGGSIPGTDHFSYGRKFIGERINLQVKPDQLVYHGDRNGLFEDISPSERDNRCEQIAKKLSNPFSGKLFRKLSAERNINPENQIGSREIKLTPDGVGATQIIQSFLSERTLDRSLVEENLLNALNKIFNPDSYFERITTQIDPESNLWEIYLHEVRKGGRVALSKSGSGLKTIILVLINLILIPALESHDLNRYIFALEELENNLHPALQRRLFEYLYEITQVHDNCVFVFTTHSNVVIDIFSDRSNSQILHVKHNGEYASVTKAATYQANSDILDDLEFKASDLLQANGVIWVEGPSDRTYINKWIELYSNGTVKEGIHYQCAIYGGALKAHLSANDPTEVGRAIPIFRINKNAIFITDSDKKGSREHLNSTTKRIQAEFDPWSKSYFFVTAGRMIENYLPTESIQSAFNDESLIPIKQYESADSYMKYLKRKGHVIANKVLLAEKVSEHLTVDTLNTMYNLKTAIPKLLTVINTWNKA